MLHEQTIDLGEGRKHEHFSVRLSHGPLIDTEAPETVRGIVDRLPQDLQGRWVAYSVTTIGPDGSSQEQDFMDIFVAPEHTAALDLDWGYQRELIRQMHATRDRVEEALGITRGRQLQSSETLVLAHVRWLNARRGLHTMKIPATVVSFFGAQERETQLRIFYLPNNNVSLLVEATRGLAANMTADQFETYLAQQQERRLDVEDIEMAVSLNNSIAST